MAKIELSAAQRRNLVAQLKKKNEEGKNLGLVCNAQNYGLNRTLDKLVKELRVRLKLRAESAVIVKSLRLICEPDSPYSVTFNGHTTLGKVDGLLSLAGIFQVDNTIVELKPKFVSHPFWQLGSYRSPAFVSTPESEENYRRIMEANEAPQVLKLHKPETKANAPLQASASKAKKPRAKPTRKTLSVTQLCRMSDEEIRAWEERNRSNVVNVHAAQCG